MATTAATRPLSLKTNVTQGERAELLSLGFTPSQIERLCALRAVYPLIEQIYTKEELQRLLFLKWLHEQWSDAPGDNRLDA